jgi:hypothetical protein
LLVATSVALASPSSTLSIESKILSRVAFELRSDSPSRDVIVEEITGASVVVVVTGTEVEKGISHPL